jgi:hypothetical protein
MPAAKKKVAVKTAAKKPAGRDSTENELRYKYAREDEQRYRNASTSKLKEASELRKSDRETKKLIEDEDHRWRRRANDAVGVGGNKWKTEKDSASEPAADFMVRQAVKDYRKADSLKAVGDSLAKVVQRDSVKRGLKKK